MANPETNLKKSMKFGELETEFRNCQNTTQDNTEKPSKKKPVLSAKGSEDNVMFGASTTKNVENTPKRSPKKSPRIPKKNIFGDLKTYFRKCQNTTQVNTRNPPKKKPLLSAETLKSSILSTNTAIDDDSKISMNFEKGDLQEVLKPDTAHQNTIIPRKTKTSRYPQKSQKKYYLSRKKDF